jgi:hypothetical protein
MVGTPSFLHELRTRVRTVTPTNYPTRRSLFLVIVERIRACSSFLRRQLGHHGFLRSAALRLLLTEALVLSRTNLGMIIY